MTFENLYTVVMSEIQWMNMIWIILTIALFFAVIIGYRKFKQQDQLIKELCEDIDYLLYKQEQEDR